MKLVVVGDPSMQVTGEITTFLARRRALGQDTSDEVWEGEYHVVPAAHSWHGIVENALAEFLGPRARAAGLVGSGEFNLGEEGDYRVPDGGYHRTVPSTVFVPTAAIVFEVVSPGDETWAKFDFYARHHVDEICVADPLRRGIRWFVLDGSAYRGVDRNPLLGITTTDLIAGIDWPT